MRSLTACLLVCALMIIAAMAFGQQQQGDVELQFQGSYFTTVGTAYQIGQGNIFTKVGVYFTNNLEIGVGPSLTITTTPADTKTSFGSTGFLVYSILLRGAKAVPYFGAQYFKSDFSNSNDNGSVGINAGLKYYFAKKTALDISGNYLFTLNKNSEGGVILVAVGLSFLL